MKNEIRVNVRRCARCGENHNGLAFTQLAHPVVGITVMTHWSPCPGNGEPILLALSDEEGLDPAARIVDDRLVLNRRGAEMMKSGIGWAFTSGQCVCEETPEGHAEQREVEATLDVYLDDGRDEHDK